MSTSGNPPVTSMGRRKFVKLAVGGGTAVAGTGTIVVAVRGAHQLEVTRHRAPTPTHATLGPEVAARPAGDSESVTRLLQLSDLHLRSISGHEETVAAATHQEDADVILLTGRYATRRNAHLGARGVPEASPHECHEARDPGELGIQGSPLPDRLSTILRAWRSASTDQRIHPAERPARTAPYGFRSR